MGRWVRKYWQDLIDSDLLKYRIPNLDQPGMVDVYKMLNSKRVRCFLCWDQLESKVCGDCMLTDFNGLSAQVHFSIHPDYKGKESYKIGKAGARYLFSAMKDGKPTLTTLIGALPVVNRLAIKWTEKVGFTYKTTLTNAFKCSYASPETQDAAIYQLTSKDKF